MISEQVCDRFPEPREWCSQCGRADCICPAAMPRELPKAVDDLWAEIEEAIILCKKADALTPNDYGWPENVGNALNHIREHLQGATEWAMKADKLVKEIKG